MAVETALQYRITSEQIAKFEKALDELNVSGGYNGIHPVLLQAQKDGLISMIEEMREDCVAYLASRETKTPP